MTGVAKNEMILQFCKTLIRYGTGQNCDNHRVTYIGDGVDVLVAGGGGRRCWWRRHG